MEGDDERVELVHDEVNNILALAVRAEGLARKLRGVHILIDALRHPISVDSNQWTQDFVVVVPLLEMAPHWKHIDPLTKDCMVHSILFQE